MSFSTDAVLTILIGVAPPELTNDLPEFLLCKGTQQGFELVSDLNNAGGNNCMWGEVWAAGFDYVSAYDLIGWLEKMSWDHPDFVVLVVYSERDIGPMVWTPSKGVIQESEVAR